MANQLTEATSSTRLTDLSLEQLRNIAQSHILEIEQETLLETQQQVTSQQEIQRYMKPRRKDKERSRSPVPLTQSSGPQTSSKGPKLRPAQDVIDRLRWDPSVVLDEYAIGYLERFEGIKEMPVGNWIKETTDEEFIPQHRIKYVKRFPGGGSDEIVWDRDARIDKIFESADGEKGKGEFVDEDVLSDGGVQLS